MRENCVRQVRNIMQGYEKLLNRLIDNEVEFVLIGGFAAIVHGCTTMTQDVDICCSFDEPNMKKLLAALDGFNPLHREKKSPLGKDAEVLARFKNLYLLTDLGALDILSMVEGLGQYEDVLKHSVALDLFEKSCNVLDIDGLIASKKGMGRPKDDEAIFQLKAIKDQSK